MTKAQLFLIPKTIPPADNVLQCCYPCRVVLLSQPHLAPVAGIPACVAMTLHDRVEGDPEVMLLIKWEQLNVILIYMCSTLHQPAIFHIAITFIWFSYYHELARNMIYNCLNDCLNRPLYLKSLLQYQTDLYSLQWSVLRSYYNLYYKHLWMH